MKKLKERGSNVTFVTFITINRFNVNNYATFILLIDYYFLTIFTENKRKTH